MEYAGSSSHRAGTCGRPDASPGGTDACPGAPTGATQSSGANTLTPTVELLEAAVHTEPPLASSWRSHGRDDGAARLHRLQAAPIDVKPVRQVAQVSLHESSPHQTSIGQQPPACCHQPFGQQPHLQPSSGIASPYMARMMGQPSLSYGASMSPYGAPQPAPQAVGQQSPACCHQPFCQQPHLQPSSGIASPHMARAVGHDVSPSLSYGASMSPYGAPQQPAPPGIGQQSPALRQLPAVPLQQEQNLFPTYHSQMLGSQMSHHSLAPPQVEVSPSSRDPHLAAQVLRGQPPPVNLQMDRQQNLSQPVSDQPAVQISQTGGMHVPPSPSPQQPWQPFVHISQQQPVIGSPPVGAPPPSQQQSFWSHGPTSLPLPTAPQSQEISRDAPKPSGIDDASHAKKRAKTVNPLRTPEEILAQLKPQVRQPSMYTHL